MLTRRRPGSPERNRWNTSSRWDRASSNCRTKSATFRAESPLPVPRPSCSQITSVPLEPMCSAHGIEVRSSRNWTCHLPDSAMWSRFHRAHAVVPLVRLTTVSTRHWENEAVFRPSPNLPRSDFGLSSRGFRLPNRIASRSPSSVNPTPSSRMPTLASVVSVLANMWIVSACAAMQLSTRSARAVLSEYPIARMLSMSGEGLGGISMTRT